MPWDQDRLAITDYVAAVDTIDKRRDEAERRERERARG